MYIFTLALAAGDPNARVPYGSIQASQVVGFPPNIDFKPPSHYGVSNLRLILENADQISFRGMYVCTYVQIWYSASDTSICDQACKNQPCVCKKLPNVFFCSIITYKLFILAK